MRTNPGRRPPDEATRILRQARVTLSHDMPEPAGFVSRPKPDTVLTAVFGITAEDLPAAANTEQVGTDEPVRLQLEGRTPLAADPLLDWLEKHAVPGVEEVDDRTYRRIISLPNGPGLVTLTPANGRVWVELDLTSLRCLPTALGRIRTLLDLDADPAPINEALAADGVLAPLVARHPGLRCPGSVNGFEAAVRAVVGQQISVTAARTVLGRLVSAAGRRLRRPAGALSHEFPDARRMLAADLGTIGLTNARQRTLRALATATLKGEVALHPGIDHELVREQLEAIRGIGPWTAGYVAMRGLGDPDIFLPGDRGLQRAAADLGLETDPAHLNARSQRWRPWRSYAAQHLWRHAIERDRNEA